MRRPITGAGQSSRAMRPMVRGQNHNVFRSGEWAEIVGVSVQIPLGMFPRRICFDVKFDDGATDTWPIEDAAAEYEFRPSLNGSATDAQG